MSEAVHPITALTPHTHILHRIHKRFTFRFIALRRRLQSRLARTGNITRRAANTVPPSVARPLPSSGAFVCCLAAVVETEGAMAGVTTKREEIELAAVGVLAMGADGFEVIGLEHGEGLV